MAQKLRLRAQRPAMHRDSAAQSLAALAAHRRDVILEAIAKSAEELLRAGDQARAIPKVLEQIGHATGVDRIHVLEVDPVAIADQGHILEHYLWSAPGISTPPAFNNAKGTAMAAVGLGSWLPRLAKGEIIVGHVGSFEETACKFFEQAGVKSAMAVPVFVEGRWWGHIGFDDCRCEREWLPNEIDTLKILAELIGSAIARTRRLQSLADANRIIESSPTILYRLGPREPFPLIYISHNINRYGYEADELLASPNHWAQLIESDDLPAIMADIRSIERGTADHVRTQFRLNKPDGSNVFFEGEGNALRDAERRLIAIEGILTDVTERKRAAEKIEALARTDVLTGLPNRAAFLDRLNLAFARARRGANPFAVHYLDLDHFKDVNDTLGHPVGDALLREVADRLQRCVRDIDLVARIGGDEFAVLQDEIVDVHGAEALATKIGKSVAASYSISGNEIHTTASIGIVPYCADVESVDAMMMKADLALYRAKDEGRNQFRFHQTELDRLVQERVAIGEDLRRAIEREEFELYYQPQVELASGRIVGLESLIRWHHPTRGLLLPASFIPTAETTGSILQIGTWVIEQACHQIRAWRNAGIVLPVLAVNLSGAQFKLACGLDRAVSDNLAKYNIDPNELELELTETALLETTEKHSRAFERLRRIGVRLAIDDFGTGYSSLDYLRSYRVSRLKIDCRFIEHVTTDPDDATIVRATIGLAHSLGIEVVAEGVETAEQRTFLLSAGCKFAQGYLLGAPMAVDRATELLRHKLQCGPVQGGQAPLASPPRGAESRPKNCLPPT